MFSAEENYIAGFAIYIAGREMYIAGRGIYIAGRAMEIRVKNSSFHSCSRAYKPLVQAAEPSADVPQTIDNDNTKSIHWLGRFCVILKTPVTILQENSRVRPQKQCFFAKNFGRNEIIAYLCTRLLHITPINNMKWCLKGHNGFQN